MSNRPFLGIAFLLVGPLVSVSAESTRFRRHVLDADSTYCACAVLDVNLDGRLDVVSGGSWFSAPDWKRKKLRDVEMIRGRFDDYSNLPLDVNGDGRIDLISANYRSELLYWVENLGPDQEWKRHVIDKPGPSETGRLVDIDGDGDLDLLPNGTTYCAWWELQRSTKDSGEATIQWVRHELPPQLAGHGLGFGDVNGDGRGDLVSARGWAEAPQDRINGQWSFHPEWELHRDCSIPILVMDTDSDQDADIVWGRGHSIGMYWLEQQQDDGERRWIKHAMDTSWSQPHSLLLADLDNDGHQEVVAGKRYLGHDGKDPGEYDPLGIYSYRFDPSAKSWKRTCIYSGGQVGFGLDPKAADIDADGDVDLVCPGRSGLYWLENLIVNKSGASPDVIPKSPKYDNHTEVREVRDAAGMSRQIKTPFEMAIRRQHILDGMMAAMGPMPDPSQRVPLDMETISSEETEKYVRRRIQFHSEPNDRVPAFLLMPRGLKKKTPAMLCLHQTTGIGKGEPAGLGGSKSLHYAHELANLGFVCLVPDYPSFGDYPYDFKTKGSHFASGSMKAIWNNVRAVDLLESLPEVDADRIGCIGHSLGGHNALFTAAFDQRLKAVVTSCGFTAFHHYYGGKLAGWTSDRYMPRIRDEFGNDPNRVPFDFYEVLAAIAPRAIFVNAPMHDSNFDNDGVKKVMAAAIGVHELLGSKDKLQAVYPDSGHDFPDPVRQQAYEWLTKQLKL